MNIDPIITTASSLALAVILVNAAVHKLRAPYWFARQIEEYELLPSFLNQPVARVLPMIETSLALGLIWEPLRTQAAWLALTLIILYAMAISINLWRGRNDMDCGCSGPGASQPLHSSLLLRNGLLIFMALLAAWPILPRYMSVLDGFIIGASAICLLLIYASLDGLLTNRHLLLDLTGKS